jgi:hypothetical protein
VSHGFELYHKYRLCPYYSSNFMGKFSDIYQEQHKRKRSRRTASSRSLMEHLAIKPP